MKKILQILMLLLLTVILIPHLRAQLRPAGCYEPIVSSIPGSSTTVFILGDNLSRNLSLYPFIGLKYNKTDRKYYVSVQTANGRVRNFRVKAITPTATTGGSNCSQAAGYYRAIKGLDVILKVNAKISDNPLAEIIFTRQDGLYRLIVRPKVRKSSVSVQDETCELSKFPPDPEGIR